MGKFGKCSENLTRMRRTASFAGWDHTLAEKISRQKACKIVAPNRGTTCHTARQWAQAARREGRVADPLSEDLVAERANLRRENRELQGTNELLKAESACFTSEPDP